MSEAVLHRPASVRAAPLAWLSSHRLALAIGLTVVLLAGGARLATFHRYLPYLEYSDESYMYLLSRAFRGVEQVAYIPERLAGYPPLYVWMQSGIQALYEAVAQRPWYLPSDYIYVLRLVAVAAGVLTALAVTAIGWQLAGPVAGFFAGLVWSFAPIIVDNNSLAIADPMGYLACALAVAAALRAWQKRSPYWLFACLLASIASIYIKYWTLYPLLLWAIVAARLAWREGRRSIRWLAPQLAVGAVFAAGLLRYLLASGLSRLSPEMTAFTDQGTTTVLSLERNLNNLRYFPMPIGTVLFWGVLLLGADAYLYS